ncbi:MAG: phasin family protein [Gammaproteobacteria bacterium]
MRNEYVDTLSKIYQCVSKPMANLAELNINTFNNLTKNTIILQKFSQIKKPEDFLAAQMELINNASVEMTQYAQKACHIGLEAFSEGQKVWNDIFHETTAKAVDLTKRTNTGSVKSKEKERE